MQARCVPIHSDSGLIHRNIIKMLCKVKHCLTSVNDFAYYTTLKFKCQVFFYTLIRKTKYV